MGNCINIPSTKTVKVLVCNGVEEDFKARTRVEEITSASGPYEEYVVVKDSHPYLPLPPEAKLRSGEVYYLIPVNRNHGKGSPPKLVNGGQRVKIVVTKQQLELLVKSAKKFRSRLALQALKDRGRYQKWRPSLATIPEL